MVKFFFKKIETRKLHSQNSAYTLIKGKVLKSFLPYDGKICLAFLIIILKKKCCIGMNKQDGIADDWSH